MRKNVWSIALTYALVAGLWIFFSDRLLIRFGTQPEVLLEWSIAKGLLFVAVTAALLYVLISRLTFKLWSASQSWLASERKFRTLFEEITDGIVVVDLESKHIYLANHAFSQMLGIPVEELRGLHVSALHPPEAMLRVVEKFEELECGLSTLASDLPVLRRDGSVFYADISASSVDLEAKRYVIGVFRDITPHKHVEEDLKNAKEAAETANRAKDQFIAVLSHELRTPLTPSLATVTALQETLGDPARKDLEIVRRNLELESKLIDDLLDVTRISRGKIDLHFERTDLHESVRNAVGICRAEIQAKGIQCSLRLEAARSFVWGDPPRLQQIFWNLLANAVKFTPKGGSITLRSVNASDAVRVEIADTGIGIDPGEFSRLFLPFEQGEQTKNRRYGGLGIGLSIAKNLVELHHGSLTGSSPGKDQGATFAVELPIMERAAPPPAPPPPNPAPGAPLPRILLVDDHADTLHVLGLLLRKWHYSVEMADSVQSALQLAEKERFDILISDLALPDGSGRDIMAEVKARYGLRGIALSGFGADADLEASLAAGFEEHLVKPISFASLQSALQRILDEQAAERPGP
ncbi:MAG: ATP-binding protein [Verrucomicrobiota bacterium]